MVIRSIKCLCGIVFLCISLFSLGDAIYAPVSLGELIDKITILCIKKENVKDRSKLNNIQQELELLESIYQVHYPFDSTISALRKELKIVNQVLWAIEDLIREEEYAARYIQKNLEKARFDAKFILLARLVYFVNDERVAIKRRINEYVKSSLVEEKEYSSYN